MGGFISTRWSDCDEISPVSGLTRSEICAIQKSWLNIYADPIGNGNVLFRLYLDLFPEDRILFKWMKDLREEDYIDSSPHKAHMLYVMNTFNLVVNKMEEPDIVAAIMRKIGESHGRRKIYEDRFYGVKKVVITMYTEVLKVDELTINAWGKMMDFWFKNIFQTLHISDTNERAVL